MLFSLLAVVTAARKLPKAVVINLPKHEARYEGAKRELNAAGVRFERMDAVEGRRLSPAEKRANVTALARALITPGMTGCFLSHRRCWERCVALDQDLLVFEDDIMLEADFARRAARHTAAYPSPRLSPSPIPSLSLSPRPRPGPRPRPRPRPRSFRAQPRTRTPAASS